MNEPNNNVNVPIDVLQNWAKSLEDMNKVEVEYTEDPLEMANTTIRRLRGRILSMKGKVNAYLQGGGKNI